MAKIKFTQACSVGSETFEKGQIVDLPDYPGTRRQMLTQVAQMGFAETVSEKTPAKTESEK